MQSPVWEHLRETTVYIAVGECERFYSECVQLADRLRKEDINVRLRIVSPNFRYHKGNHFLARSNW